MLKGGDEGEDPIDAHYKKLKTEIVVCTGFHLLHFCFCLIEQYIFSGGKFFCSWKFSHSYRWKNIRFKLSLLFHYMCIFYGWWLNRCMKYMMILFPECLKDVYLTCLWWRHGIEMSWTVSCVIYVNPCSFSEKDLS